MNSTLSKVVHAHRYNVIKLFKLKALHLAYQQSPSENLASNIKAVYDSSIVEYAKSPTAGFFPALVKLGNDIGKMKQEVKVDIYHQLDKQAVKAVDFKFKRYIGDGYASLDDFSGEVLLATYWFPACEGCRREFPHFQHALNKFDPNQVAFLGINIVPAEDELVVPFVKSTGYSMIPVAFNESYHGNVSTPGYAPVNYLIGAKGNIVYSHFRIGANNEQQLVLMIQLLLDKYQYSQTHHNSENFQT